MEKLELHHLDKRLSKGVKVINHYIEGHTYEDQRISKLSVDHSQYLKGNIWIVNVLEHQFKPILRPLSDFYDRPHYGMINKDDDIQDLPYRFYQRLLDDHADVDNLIEKGLAINVNTLKENPYE